MSTRNTWEFLINVPRHAFSPREVARPADIWRALQDAAVEGSSRAGWPPKRYREAGTMFVVYSMNVVHHRELEYGERVIARTWIWNVRRATLCTREVRLIGTHGPIASATQEWVHVNASNLAPTRGSQDLVDAFQIHESENESQVTLPTWTPLPGAPRTFSFEVWQTWMDTLGHVNHPDYLAWCDEAIARELALGGAAVTSVSPVAESIRFRSSVNAGDHITLETRRKGITESGAIVFEHRIRKGHNEICAEATTIREPAPNTSRSWIDRWD